MLLTYMVQSFLGYMGPTVAMQYTAIHMVSVSKAYLAGERDIIYAQTGPVLIFMFLFSGVPILSAMCRCGGFMLGFRMN
eukprot:4917410-Amphidinium_carterae.1